MRRQTLWRLGTAAAVVLSLVVADTAQAQRRGRIFRGRGGWSGGYSGGYYSTPWFSPSYVPSSSPWYSPSPETYLPATNPPAEVGTPGTEAAGPADSKITFTVRVPSPDVSVSVGEQRLPGEGTSRTFVSPALPRGQRYSYYFTATWTRDGREVTETREAVGQAGERLTVDFTAAPARADTTEIVPRELPETLPTPKMP